ncbi:MAG: ABC transporter ATP-binding protein/permease [Candidatus Omnitrophica bacterium]|nr:ABC transporter ATP-binding protein/permease [Candidatus Omnitrophota bacterium]
MEKVSKFLKIILPYYKSIILLLFLNIFSLLLSLVNPYLGKLAIDDAILKKDFKRFLYILILGGFLFCVGRLIDFLNNYIREIFKQKIKYKLNCKVFLHLHSLPFWIIKQKTSTQYLYMFENDTEYLANTIVSFFELIYIFFIFLSIVLILIFFDIKIILFLLVISLIFYLVFSYWNNKLRKITENLIILAENIVGILEELLFNILLVKVFLKEKDSFRKYKKNLEKFMSIYKKQIFVLLSSSFLNEINTKIILGLFFLYGGYQVIKGNFSLGSFGAITAYLYKLFEAATEFFSWRQQNSLGIVSYRRLNQLLEEPQVKEDLKDFEIEGKSICFEKINFGYQNVLVFKDLNFFVKAKYIALAGPSGCGKTTLLHLLLKLYKPISGKIFIDGIDLEEISSSCLLKQVGIALQEPILWNATINENIRYAKEDATEKELKKVIYICGLSGLDANYNIGESAFKLSAGQRQKVAIARALIKNPKILILDEATSCLDLESQHFIISNIKKYYPQIGIIFVSHRTSLLKEAEVICYFQGPNKIIVDNFKNLFNYSEFRRFLNIC